MKKIVCFNAPPESGKDTGALFLQKTFGGEIYSIASPIKKIVADIYKVPISKLEKNKNQSLPELLSCTPRECYIQYGEAIKQLHGDNYWIDFTIERIKNSQENLFFITDLGFQKELNQLVKTFEIENVLLLKLFRQGCTFDNDSRYYVNNLLEFNIAKGKNCFVNCLEIQNNGTLKEYHQQLIEKTSKILRKYESKTNYQVYRCSGN